MTNCHFRFEDPLEGYTKGRDGIGCGIDIQRMLLVELLQIIHYFDTKQHTLVGQLECYKADRCFLVHMIKIGSFARFIVKHLFTQNVTLRRRGISREFGRYNKSCAETQLSPIQ